MSDLESLRALLAKAKQGNETDFYPYHHEISPEERDDPTRPGVTSMTIDGTFYFDSDGNVVSS